MIVTPTIHLNGTSGDDLMSQTVEAMLALSDAIEIIDEATIVAKAEQQEEDDFMWESGFEVNDY